MDFGLSEEQELLRRTARDFLLRECPKSLVRQLAGEESGYSPALWRKIADLGWLGLAFPEEFGGAGGSFIDLTVLLEEMGRACLPSPFFSTVILGGLTALNAGTNEQKLEILPAISQGTLKVALALTEAQGGYDPKSIEARAELIGDDFVLSGVKLFTLDALVADILIGVFKTGACNASDEVSLFLIPADTPGLTITSLQTVGGDRQYETAFDRVKVPASALLGALGQGWPAVEQVLQHAAVAKCAEMVGQSQAALELASNYAKERVQFDRPIGSFQAIQHHCANMVIDVNGARLITYQAAWLLSRGVPCSKEVSMAKAWVSLAARRVAALAHRICGGIGLTTEHDMPLYSGRIRAGEVLFGGYSVHFERVAREIGLG